MAEKARVGLAIWTLSADTAKPSVVLPKSRLSDLLPLVGSQYLLRPFAFYGRVPHARIADAVSGNAVAAAYDLGYEYAVRPAGGTDFRLIDCVGYGYEEKVLRSRIVTNTDLVQEEWRFTVRSKNPLASKSINGIFPLTSDDERFLTVEDELTGGWERTAQLRRVADGTPIGDAIALDRMSTAVRLLPSDSRLVVIAGTALLSYDLLDKRVEPIRQKTGGRKHFTGIAVHPDGRRVLATCNDETVREYDAVTLQELRAYAWKVGKLRCVAIAADGATAAAGSDTGKVVVWDLE